MMKNRMYRIRVTRWGVAQRHFYKGGLPDGQYLTADVASATVMTMDDIVSVMNWLPFVYDGHGLRLIGIEPVVCPDGFIYHGTEGEVREWKTREIVRERRDK